MAGMIASDAYANDYLSFNAGIFEVFEDKETAQFGIEYRGDSFYQWDAAAGIELRPIIGGFVNADEALYGYAGLHLDVRLNEQWLISPNFAVGAYEENDSLDLGGPLNFRSGLELGYELSNQHRVGLVVNHISNAGIYDRNPGENSVLVTYSVPLGSE
jgi:hypothetical protein